MPSHTIQEKLATRFPQKSPRVDVSYIR